MVISRYRPGTSFTSETDLKKTFAALALAATLISFTGAQAATISYSDAKALKKTNWTSTLNFGKFDTSLGTLNSIRFDLSGLVQGTGMAESDDEDATTVNLSLGSILKLSRPDGTQLVLSNPVFSKVFEFSAGDGNVDFAGTSGGSTGLVNASAAEFFVSTSSSDFALFSALGGGTINLGLKATGASSATGAGNLATIFQTFAAGTVNVTYDYTPFAAEVPEPASLAMILGGLGLMGLSRRRVGNKA